MDKELEYYKSQASLLEKENKELREKVVALEMQLTGYKTGENKAMQKAKELIVEVTKAKEMYDKGTKELKDNVKKSKDLLMSLKLANADIKEGIKGKE